VNHQAVTGPATLSVNRAGDEGYDQAIVVVGARAGAENADNRLAYENFLTPARLKVQESAARRRSPVLCNNPCLPLTSPEATNVPSPAVTGANASEFVPLWLASAEAPHRFRAAVIDPLRPRAV
jgi:hypothetical protein